MYADLTKDTMIALITDNPDGTVTVQIMQEENEDIAVQLPVRPELPLLRQVIDRKLRKEKSTTAEELARYLSGNNGFPKRR